MKKDPLDTGVIAPGIQKELSLAQEAARPAVPLTVGNGSLADLSNDYAFYTPALIYLSVPLLKDPFNAFCEEYGQEVQRHKYLHHSDIFQGLVHPRGDTTWNRVVMALPMVHWKPFVDWMGCCAFNNSRAGILQRVRTQDLKLSDPLDISKELPICAFCVESNVGSFYFDALSGKTPRATFDPTMVFDDTVKFAAALVDGKDPYKSSEEQK